MGGKKRDVPHETLQKVWEMKYEELVDYRRKRGHVNVSQTAPEDLPFRSLACWINEQRKSLRLGRLYAGRKERLDELGFIWKLGEQKRDDAWNQEFENLKRYKRSQGNFLVPATYKQNPKLGAWVARQRRLNRLGSLRRDRRERLEALGFVWDCERLIDYANRNTTTFDANWTERYEKLQIFYEAHGHSEVQYRKDDPDAERRELQRWVHAQRSAFREGRLQVDRKERLDQLKFVWRVDYADPENSVSQSRWEKLFDRLLDFKKVHGHFNVPAKYNDDPELGCWVDTQRARYASGILDSRREGRFQSVGFNFCGLNYHNQPGVPQSPTKKRRGNPGEDADQYPRTRSRISVFWESEGVYFNGTVKKREGPNVYIEYDDGDTEWIDIREHKWRMLPGVNINVDYAIGTPVKKYFAGHGWFEGEVVGKTRKGFKVVYEDGDEEAFDEGSIELATIVQKAGESSK